MKAIFLAAVYAVCFGAASTAHAACDEAKLSRLDRLLASERPDWHVEIVAAGLREACSLPKSLERGFEKLSALGRAGQQLSAATVIEADPLAWSRACAGGLRVVTQAAAQEFSNPQFGPRQFADQLWTGCAVEKLAIATHEEWLRVGPTAVLALAAHAWMREAKMDATRVRGYTRALAGLDEPPRRTLAERYPDRGPGAVPAAPSLEIKLSHYLGSRTVAQTLAETVRAAGNEMASCLAGLAPPPGLTLRLVVADGVAQNGELLVVRTIGPNSTEARRFSGRDEIERCLLAVAGRLRFAVFAQPTTIELEIMRGANVTVTKDGLIEGGVISGMVGGPKAPYGRDPATLPVLIVRGSAAPADAPRSPQLELALEHAVASGLQPLAWALGGCSTEVVDFTLVSKDGKLQLETTDAPARVAACLRRHLAGKRSTGVPPTGWRFHLRMLWQ